MRLYWSFFESGKSKADAKDYGNVIHPCMLQMTGTIDR